MGTTTKGIRYPEQSSTVNTAVDIQNLASDIDSVYGTQQFSLTTLGDLLTHNGTSTARLPMGKNYQQLIVDSSTSTGLGWGAPTYPGMTLISRLTPSSISEVVYTSIPQVFRSLMFFAIGVGSGSWKLAINASTLADPNAESVDYSVIQKTLNGGSVHECTYNYYENNKTPQIGYSLITPGTYANRPMFIFRIDNYAEDITFAKVTWATGGERSSNSRADFIHHNGVLSCNAINSLVLSADTGTINSPSEIVLWGIK